MYILHFQFCFIILVYTCSNRWECKHKSCDADMASKSHVMCLAFRWCEQCRWEWGWKIWCSGWRCWGGEWRWDFWWHAATCRLRCWSEIRCGVHRWLQQWNQRSRNRGRCNARGHVWCREGSWWKQFGAWGGHWAMCRSWRKGGRFCKPATSRREKKYHLSEEWKKLEALSEKDGFPYTRLPDIVGCSIARHPSGSFWSARYPGEPWHTCKWGPERDAFSALLRIVRHIVKLHIKAAPLDSDQWKAHLEGMSHIDPSSVWKSHVMCAVIYLHLYIYLDLYRPWWFCIRSCAAWHAMLRCSASDMQRQGMILFFPSVVCLGALGH